MSNQRFVLNTGSEIPALGLDFAHSRLEDLENSMFNNYRHFHILSGEASEKVLGRALGHAITEGTLERSKVFLTVTIACTPNTNIEKVLGQTLSSLGVDYVDLCLMEWDHTASSNEKSHIDIYKDFENLKRRWKTRAVGVSRYSVEALQELMPLVSMKPAVNRFDVTLSKAQAELVDYCNWNGVLTLASASYIDTGVDRGSDAALVQQLAKKYQTTPSNITYNWHTLSRRAVLVDSPSVVQLSRVDLTRREMQLLDELSQKGAGSRRYCGVRDSAVEPRYNERTEVCSSGVDAKARQVLPVR